MDLEVTHNGIHVSRASPKVRESWDRYVEQSPHATVFHRLGFLETVADHSSTTLHPLIGFKGQEPVGIFPIFELTRGFVTTVFSPPPEMGLSQLGPAMLNVEKMKRRSTEKRTKRFLDGCFEWIERAIDPSYVNVRTPCKYSDHRPFGWNGFDLTPRYTYLVDLTPGSDEIKAEFSSDARRNIRVADDEDAEYTITEEAPAAIDRIIDHLDRRHGEQGMKYPVDPSFVRDLYYRLSNETLRAYVCRIDDEYASGMITLENERTVYRWQGGARPIVETDLPVNDLLDWRIMTDAIGRGREQYDLVGANTPALCEYKSKFGPELRSYQTAERGTRTMQLVSMFYRGLR